MPEKTLHLIALFGGWPGALIGQRVFRHKTQKLGYRIVFWLCVVLHLAVVGGVVCLLQIRAFIIVGFVWWAWHLPLAFIQPAQDQTTLAVVSTHLCGLLGAIFYDAVLVWIRYGSESIFPVALAHVSFNNITAAGVILMDLNPMAQPVLNMTAAALACGLLWRFKAWDLIPQRGPSLLKSRIM